MSIFLWGILATAGFLLAVVIYFRLTNPISAKMTKEQEQLNRKTGVNDKKPPAYEKKETGADKKPEWPISQIVVVSLVGIGAFIWSVYETPGIRPSGMGNLGKEYWLQILIVWITLGVLIALNKETPKVFQMVLAGAMLTLLVILPIWSWMSNPSAASAEAKRMEIPSVQGPESSWPEPSWAEVALPKEGARSEVFAVLPKKRLVLFGNGIRVHCVYQDGHEESYTEKEGACQPGEVRGNYVTNLEKGLNSFRIASAPVK